MPKQNSRTTKWTLGSVGALIIAVAAAWFGLGDDSSCTLEALPAEAVEVVSAVQAGGPFEYPDNDGVHFGNYEGQLPPENSDFYREYTVETPGLNHRGARRIVTGGGEDTDPETWYYTSDHYESFCEIPDAE
ncbi:ribonuclease domain-containing protein [Corynebacterium sp. A21]|uniref:ribonuclease domain-containing protein n=1 Tax=Corynebacterium sp. A21 TaxID=3457318 RepID=UPI003FD464C8